MGIINITPDSFYDGGRYYQNEKAILERAEKLLREGASLLDVGGYSSRPGAEHISADVEKERVVSAIAAIIRVFPEAYISVDTFRAEVAREAVETGACLINDISGGSMDPLMFETVAALQVPYVLMHMRGTPQTMKQHTHYEHMLLEILDYFQRKIAELRMLGIKDIIIDPGFGFAKTIDQNYELMRHLEDLQVLRVPMLVGVSRKSMVYKRFNIPVEDSLNGTSVLHTLSLLQGASIIRVHDVKEAIQTIQLLKYIDR